MISGTLKTLQAIPDKRVFKTMGYTIKEDWENNTVHCLHIVFDFPYKSKDGQDLMAYARRKDQLFIFKSESEVYTVHRLRLHIIPSNKYVVGNFHIINSLEACEFMVDNYHKNL